jgi:hypothetical protein
MEYSGNQLSKHLGRPVFVSDGSDSSDEVVLSSRSSSAPNRSRATSPTRGLVNGKRRDYGKGKGKGKQREEAEKKEQKGKVRRRASSVDCMSISTRDVSPELGGRGALQLVGREKERVGRMPEEHYWRNLDVDAGVPPLDPLTGTTCVFLSFML